MHQMDGKAVWGPRETRSRQARRTGSRGIIDSRNADRKQCPYARIPHLQSFASYLQSYLQWQSSRFPLFAIFHVAKTKGNLFPHVKDCK